MLEFNPYFRNSADQILKHKIFDACRQEYPDNEMSAEWKIKLACDEEGAFDYEEISTKMTIADMKKTLEKEIELVKGLDLFKWIMPSKIRL